MNALGHRTHVRPRMGTLLAATLPVGRCGAPLRHLHAVFDTATACERVMSRHQPASDVSRLNRASGDREGISSTELAEILAVARALSEATGGAFDPTAGPLLGVWRRAARRGRRPSTAEITRARRLVDWRGIIVRSPHVALARPGMAIDLGAFGKGIALDRIVSRLRREDCRSAVVNFGESSVISLGQSARGPWRIVLRHPLGGFAGSFALDHACSTSATFGQAMRLGSTVVGHVVDPRTGHSLHTRAQVTVLARSAAVAEAASTALLVLGRRAMETCARDLGVDACWVDASGIYQTAGFPLQRVA